MVPSRRARNAGLSTGSREVSFTIVNTSVNARPSASAVVQPVNRSATGLTMVTLPSASVTITPSPIECNVVCRRSVSRRSPARASCNRPDISLISQPLSPNIASATTLGKSTPTSSHGGLTNSSTAAAPLSTVAAMPSRKPPYHAAVITAAKNVRYGTSSCRTGERA